MGRQTDEDKVAQTSYTLHILVLFRQGAYLSLDHPGGEQNAVSDLIGVFALLPPFTSEVPKW